MLRLEQARGTSAAVRKNLGSFRSGNCKVGKLPLGRAIGKVPKRLWVTLYIIIPDLTSLVSDCVMNKVGRGKDEKGRRRRRRRR